MTAVTDPVRARGGALPPFALAHGNGGSRTVHLSSSSPYDFFGVGAVDDQLLGPGTVRPVEIMTPPRRST